MGGCRQESPLLHENIKACGFYQTSAFYQFLRAPPVFVLCSLMGGVKVNGAFSNYLELRWQKSRESDPRARFCQGSHFSHGCFWFECCVIFDLLMIQPDFIFFWKMLDLFFLLLFWSYLFILFLILNNLQRGDCCAPFTIKRSRNQCLKWSHGGSISLIRHRSSF